MEWLPIQKENPVMKTASAIARYLAGVIFLVFGLNGFLNFIPLPPGRHCGTVHGRTVCIALPVGDLRVSGRRSGASAGQPLRAARGGRAGAGDRQHPCFPCLDGPERASAGLFVVVVRAVVFADVRPAFAGLFQPRWKVQA